MAVLDSGVYFSRLAEGCREEDARLAAEETARRADPMPNLVRDLAVIKWMLSAEVALSPAVLVVL